MKHALPLSTSTEIAGNILLNTTTSLQNSAKNQPASCPMCKSTGC
ncbi:hypothetical protein OQY15_01560 [Pedobacter sp. MC2016-15]|nr:hypothetical protein [Pedobacter sp. MC2016-15]